MIKPSVIEVLAKPCCCIIIMFLCGCFHSKHTTAVFVETSSSQQETVHSIGINKTSDIDVSPREFIENSTIPAKQSALELSAEEIIRRVDDVRSPQLDYTIAVEVESFSPSGATKSATYEVMIKGRDKTIIKTMLPEVERGRILLMTDRNLWAFFPDVSKPLRISLQERLIGDVSNGDIARVNFSGDYDPKIVRSEIIDGKNYYVLELIAKNPEVTYGKAILWVGHDHCWPKKAEFYAISGRLLKTCSYESYVMMASTLRPSQLVMVDPIVKGKKSIIRYNQMRLGEIPEKYFTKDYMKKMMQ